jgi:hypothetical protein
MRICWGSVLYQLNRGAYSASQAPSRLELACCMLCPQNLSLLSVQLALSVFLINV